MSKNKKPTKIDNVKKIPAESSANAKRLNSKNNLEQDHSNRSSSKQFKGFNFSAGTITEQMKDFVNSSLGSFCGKNNVEHDASMANNMMSKLTNNLQRNFEQNIELSRDVLKCKTAADFIEFQRKHFETNYKNTAKLLSDLFYDVQNLTQKNLNLFRPKNDQPNKSGSVTN